MKVFKTSELNRGKIFHIQDHDRHFHFIGRFRYCGLDFMQFDVLPMKEAPSCKTLGMYAFDIGSKFTLHSVTWDDKQQDYVADQWIVSSKDLEKDVDDVKKDAEEKDMKLDSWKDCVIKDDTWSINPIMKKGDRVYRFFNDKFDIKANMTINYLGYGMIGFHMDDTDTDITNMEIDESMRVCATHSPDDSGIPVRIDSNKFNPELRVGKLYWIANADLEFQYVMHVRSITDESINVDLISTINGLDNTSRLDITGKSFDITELLEYKFQEV